MTAPTMAEVLAEHGPAGVVNSREGWVECECGERLFLPSGLTFDGYPEMLEEERKARDAHVAAALTAAGYGHVASVDAEVARTAAKEAGERIAQAIEELLPGSLTTPDRIVSAAARIARGDTR